MLKKIEQMTKKIYLLLLFLIAVIPCISIASSVSAPSGNITENINYLDAAEKNQPVTPSSMEPPLPTLSKPNNPSLSVPIPPPLDASVPLPGDASVPLPGDAPVPLPVVPIMQSAEAVAESPKDHDVAVIKEEDNKPEQREALINKLMDLNYNTKTPPKQLYERQDTLGNKHLPPIYFKSYYLSLAFKAIDNNDINNLRAVLMKFDFINGQNKDGDTLLIHAVETNSLNSARVLLAKGAYVNGVNNRGRTALHYAATLGNLDIIKLLLTMGADEAITDDKGLMAIDYAQANKHPDAVIMISQYKKK